MSLEATVSQKLSVSIGNALRLLDELTDPSLASDQKGVDMKIWKATAEAEYASFLLSLGHHLGDFNPEIKEVNPHRGVKRSAISRARDLLGEALSSVKSDPVKAYTRIRQALIVLRLLQEGRSQERSC